MPNNCPSCGAKVKEEFKFCLSCGAPLQTGGAVDTQNFESQVVPPPSQPQQSTPPSPPTGQAYGQTQTYAPMQPKKSSSKLIGGIIGIIIVVVVIAVVLFMVMGGGTDSRFVATWQIEGGDIDFGTTMVLQGNGDWEIGFGGSSMKIGTWNIQGSDLCFTVTNWLPGMDQSQGATQCYQYEFTNNGNALYLTSLTEGSMTLTKR